MVKIDLPYLTRDRDPRGNIRHYVRARKWRRKIRIKEAPGSPEFFAAYHAAVAELEAERRAGAGREKDPASLRWLIEAYYQSAAYKRLARGTRDHQRWALDRACEHKGDGAKPYRLLEPKHIRQRMDALAEQPGAANSYLKSKRSLFRWAVKAGHADRNPASEVSRISTRSDGHHTWTEEEVADFEAHHPIGTAARLAFALLLYTGVRRGDVIRLGRQMVKGGWLTFTMEKTKDELSIPVLPALQQVIDASPSPHLTFITTQKGAPYSPGRFSYVFRAWCDEAGLPQRCTPHGLRKCGATRAAEAGATEHELMAIFGWKTPAQAATYTRKANRKRLAQASMPRVGQGRVSPESGNVSHLPQLNGNKGKNR